MDTHSLEQQLAELQAENGRLRDRFSQMARLSREVTESLDIGKVLQSVVDAACELTGARYGAVGIFGPDGEITEFITHGLSAEERERIGALPRGRGLLGWLHHVQAPLRLPDLARHERSVGFPAHHPPMKSFLGSPIRHGNESLGNIYLTEKLPGVEFTPEDEALLVLFAAQAALAVHNARLHAVVEADRQTLFTQQERLRALVETTPVGVFVIDAKTNALLLVNREGQRLAGSSLGPGDAMEPLLQAMRDPEPRGREKVASDNPVIRALRGERTQAEEMRMGPGEGRSIPVLVSATPARSPDGAIVAAITVVQDISPVEELERLRTEFLGMVSHELKTPLTAIKGSAATVLGSKRPFSAEETRELFEIVDEQADRLRDLVDNLLDMTRIESGRLSVNPASEELAPILAEVKGAFSVSGSEHSLLVTAPDAEIVLNVDRRRVIQVLNNLLSNAAKFSPTNTAVRLNVLQDSPTHVRISVRDEGRGIPKQKQTLLFRKFSQVSGDSRTHALGLGLGLAISKGIVEAHGGRIWVESEGEGKGSTFVFTLPVIPGLAAPKTVDSSQRAAHVGKVFRSGQRTKVLAVDDEPQVLRYLQRTLEDAGYQSIPVSDPAAVAGQLEREEPDLVLLDVNLPGMSGFDLLQRIREISGVPVIFLTATNDSDLMVKGLRLGADDYVVKPFAPTELLARMEAVLRRRLMPDTVEVKPVFHLGELRIDFGERSVTVAGERVALTATEYKLLYALADHAGMVLTHDQILQRVWGEEYSGATELLRSVVRNLRRKLGDDARSPRYVLTETQVGYRMPKPTTPA